MYLQVEIYHKQKDFNIFLMLKHVITLKNSIYSIQLLHRIFVWTFKKIRIRLVFHQRLDTLLDVLNKIHCYYSADTRGKIRMFSFKTFLNSRPPGHCYGPKINYFPSISSIVPGHRVLDIVYYKFKDYKSSKL